MSIFLGERLLTVYLVYGVLMVTSSVVVYSLFPATSATSAYHKLEDQEALITSDKDSGDELDDEIFEVVDKKGAELSI